MKTTISDKKAYTYDCLALGEVMLRFDPGDTAVAHAVNFKIWEGGGEYNVVRGLTSCFGKKTAIVTSLVDNSIGHLIRGRIEAGGVNSGLIHWVADDGIGESARNGLYFLDRGFGIRPAIGTMDRGHSAISQLRPEDIDWDILFGKVGVRWFHTGGIMAGLSESSPEVVIVAMKSAKKHGTTISYDLNYRPSLWKRFGGKQRADEVNRRILKYVDVLFGVDNLEREPIGLETELFKKSIERIAGQFPNLRTIVTTMRSVKTARINDWGGLLWQDGEFFEGNHFENLDIYDRVGGGDAFDSGVIYGMLEGAPPDKTLNYGILHGALAMTTPGDNSMTSFAAIEQFMNKRDSSVQR